MNPFTFVWRRPVTTLLIILLATAVAGLGLNKAGVAISPAIDPTLARVNASLASATRSSAAEHEEKAEGEQAKIVVTSPLAKDVVITQQYVCQIRSQKHIEVCAMENGYLDEILVKEGQAIKKGDLMFRIVPTLFQARMDAETAEAKLAELEYNNTKKLFEQRVVSENELFLLQAKLAKARAKANLAGAELNFTNVRAPFDGIVDRLERQLGSLIKEGDVLTTLSDNDVMWVYFNVREAQYLDYMADAAREKKDDVIELVLADGRKFSETGKIGAIEANFNSETGNIPFRADFPNPKRLLRHGQTGTILIHRTLKDAIVIPQRATFELLDKRYVYVVGDDHVAHQRLITILHELEDTFVVKTGLEVKDKIVLEGVREVRDGNKLEYEYVDPKEVLGHQKFHAE